MDRLICQAIAQVLTPIFDPYFHPHSFGFRPGRSQHQAVERARQLIADDAAWCVDFDLDSFFDRVQHDALMARVARRVHDKRVLRLIRRYLEAGVMEGGLVAASEGCQAIVPLSSLLSNVMLDDLDWELDRRGHRFVRFADDGRIYVSSRRAGERVMASITQYIEQRLKLRVNREKSVVDRATKRPLLGLRFAYRGDRGKSAGGSQARQTRQGPPAPADLAPLGRVDGAADQGDQPLHRRVDGLLCVRRYTLPFRDLDKWLRRRLRQVRWKEWKRVRTNALPQPPSARHP